MFVIFEAAIALALPILISIPLFFLLFQTVLNRALQPVFEFSRAIGARDPDNLTNIAEKNLPTEFEAINSKLNKLLTRVRDAFESERNFSSNSAHQLRTPVAAALAQSEMLERELVSVAQIERAKKVSEALRRLGRIVEKLLQLARADLKSDLIVQKHNPYEILKILLADYSRFNPKWNFVVEGADSSNEIMTDPDALAIIFQNLIENAMSYADRDTDIVIRFDPKNQITFSNDCEVVPGSILSSLDQRFVRGGTDIRGSGLGLAIVKRLADQLKIRIEIRSPRRKDTRGFEVELSFEDRKFV